MKDNAQKSGPTLFGLVDGAACPEKIYSTLQNSDAGFRSVYVGLPEEELGSASLFVVAIHDNKTEWAKALQEIDLHTPCLSLIWSRFDLDALTSHLQAFLFADIDDGMQAMVRFFDPRNTRVVLGIWGEQNRAAFMGPIEGWMYRGRHENWQSIESARGRDTSIYRSAAIKLKQAEIDVLTAHTEPDEILAALVESGHVDDKQPYFARFSEFFPRYSRALNWGISEPGDRLVFCQYSYLFGAEFDQHPLISSLLSQRKRTNESFSTAVTHVPSDVWTQIQQDSQPVTVKV